MAYLKTTCEIEDYSEQKKTSILVKSNLLYKDFVDLEIDGKVYSVIGKELHKAIDNCMNK